MFATGEHPVNGLPITAHLNVSRLPGNSEVSGGNHTDENIRTEVV